MTSPTAEQLKRVRERAIERMVRRIELQILDGVIYWPTRTNPTTAHERFPGPLPPVKFWSV